MANEVIQVGQDVLAYLDGTYQVIGKVFSTESWGDRGYVIVNVQNVPHRLYATSITDIIHGNVHTNSKWWTLRTIGGIAVTQVLQREGS